ncbi:MAG: hypothetical protein Kow0081_2000 [Candidatus Dojkabacteria bacterium]
MQTWLEHRYSSQQVDYMFYFTSDSKLLVNRVVDRVDEDGNTLERMLQIIDPITNITKQINIKALCNDLGIEYKKAIRVYQYSDQGIQKFYLALSDGWNDISIVGLAEVSFTEEFRPTVIYKSTKTGNTAKAFFTVGAKRCVVSKNWGGTYNVYIDGDPLDIDQLPDFSGHNIREVIQVDGYNTVIRLTDGFSEGKMILVRSDANEPSTSNIQVIPVDLSSNSLLYINDYFIDENSNLCAKSYDFMNGERGITTIGKDGHYSLDPFKEETPYSIKTSQLSFDIEVNDVKYPLNLVIVDDKEGNVLGISVYGGYGLNVPLSRVLDLEDVRRGVLPLSGDGINYDLGYSFKGKKLQRDLLKAFLTTFRNNNPNLNIIVNGDSHGSAVLLSSYFLTLMAKPNKDSPVDITYVNVPLLSVNDKSHHFVEYIDEHGSLDSKNISSIMPLELLEEVFKL